MKFEKVLRLLLPTFFLLFSLFMVVVFFNQPISKFTRAKEDSEPSASNSLLFAYPLNVKADGNSNTRINIFIRSASGQPIKSRRVSINTSLGFLKNPSLVTDDQGKAETYLSSDTPGVAEITALFDSVPLTQKLTVKFE